MKTRRAIVGLSALALWALGIVPAHAANEGVPTFNHVYLIIGENTELGQINTSNAPYILNVLKPQGAWFKNYFALTHFSEANYVGMMAGQFDHCQQFDGSAASCHQPWENLFSQLDGKGISWRSWMESMPFSCYLASAGSPKDRNHYGPKHNPALFFDNIEGGDYSGTRGTSSECLANDLPMGGTGENDTSAFDAAVQGGDVGQFNLVVPNECEDGHDNCKPQGNPVAQFNDFLSREIPNIQTYDPTALIIVTFDEGTSNRGDGNGHQFSGGGNVMFEALGPLVQAGTTSTDTFDHYSLLRTLEDGYDITTYLGGAALATPITGIWN
jgi:hypothetical protein